MKYLYRVYIVFALLMAFNAQSQNQIDHIFNTLTMKDGLRSVEIYHIFQQSNGFLWLGTSKGLSRYDGSKFKHYSYNSTDNNHISNNYITGIIEDKFGHIWVATEDGLNKLNLDGTIEIFKHDKQNPQYESWIQALYYDSNDTLWLGTHLGMTSVNVETNEFQLYPPNPNSKLKELWEYSLYQITEDNKGNIYFVTSLGIGMVKGAVIDMIESQSPALNRLLQVNSLSITKLASGELAIGTDHTGLLIIDFESQHYSHITSPIIKKSPITKILEHSDGTIWLGTYDEGISILSKDRLKATHLTHKEYDNNTLASNSIYSLFIDESGEIFVGSNKGLSLQEPNQEALKSYRSFFDNTGLSGNDVYSVQFLNDSELIVSTDHGIDMINIATGEIFRDWNGFKIGKKYNSSVWQIAPTVNGRMWMAASNGALYLDLADNSIHYFDNQIGNPFKLPNTEYFTVLAAENGSAWLTGYTTLGLGLLDAEQGLINRVFNQDKSEYIEQGNFSSATIYSKAGEIWMSTTDSVFRVDPNTGESWHYRIANNTDFVRVNDIIEGKDGEFWVAGEGTGLTLIKTIENSHEVHISSITTADGLASNELQTVDVHGDDIWVSTLNKISKYSSKEGKVTNYPSLFTSEGLFFNIAASIIKDDILYIGSNQGLYSVELNKIKSNTFQPNIVLTDVIFDNNSILSDLEIKSNYRLKNPIDAHYLEFHFAALDYSSSKQNTFQYKLQGYDNEWKTTQNRRAYYNNLSPGEYTFQLRAANNDGFFSDKQLSFTFNVKAPITYYILGTMGLIIILIAALFFASRQEQLKLLDTRLHTDALTEIGNRTEFTRFFDKLLTKQNQKFALIIIDLDHFKDINDLHGHHVGDKFIIEAANRMKTAIRDQDFIARIGGDEFVIIINRFDDETQLGLITNRIQQNLSHSVTLNGQQLDMSGSIGVAIFPKDGETHKKLFFHADSAMYKAKNTGRNRVCFFDEQLHCTISEQIKIKNYLTTALTNDEFKLYYQPKVSITTGQVLGFEALLRWFHPIEGLIQPNVFIKETEKSGLIIHIGDWIIRTACRHAKHLYDNNLLIDNISINVSLIQLTKHDIVPVIEQALLDTGLPADKLEIEITESILMENIEENIKTIMRLKALGISIALDDFGTGYSSFSYLTQFPIDTLKIDRSFITNSLEHPPSNIVLKSIYSLAQQLHIQVVAEGIETLEQIENLSSFKEKNLLQGYFFSRPVPFEQMLEIANMNFAVKMTPKRDFQKVADNALTV